MKPNQRPGCTCTNCNRSCYKHYDTSAKSRRTTRKQAKERLAALKDLITGEGGVKP